MRLANLCHYTKLKKQFGTPYRLTFSLSKQQRERKEKLPPPEQQTSPMVCSPAAATKKKSLFLSQKDHFSFWEALEHSWWDGLCSQPAVGSGAGLSPGRVWDLVGQHLQPGAHGIWGALGTVWSQPCLSTGSPVLVRGHWEDPWKKVWGDSKKRQMLTSSSPLNQNVAPQPSIKALL